MNVQAIIKAQHFLTKGLIADGEPGHLHDVLRERTAGLTAPVCYEKGLVQILE